MRKGAWVGRTGKSFSGSGNHTASRRRAADGKGVLGGKVFGRWKWVRSSDFRWGLTPWTWVGTQDTEWAQGNQRHKAQHGQSCLGTVGDHEVPLLGTRRGLQKGWRAEGAGTWAEKSQSLGLEICGLLHILFPWPKNCTWGNWNGGISQPCVWGAMAFSDDLQFHCHFIKPCEAGWPSQGHLISRGTALDPGVLASGQVHTKSLFLHRFCFVQGPPVSPDDLVYSIE